MSWSAPGPGRTQLMTDDEIRTIIRTMDSDGIWPTYYRAHEAYYCFCDIHRFSRLRNAIADELTTKPPIKRDRKAESAKRRADYFTHATTLHDRRVPKPREVKAPKAAWEPLWARLWPSQRLDWQIIEVESVKRYMASWLAISPMAQAELKARREKRHLRRITG